MIQSLTPTTITTRHGLTITQNQTDAGYGARQTGDYEHDALTWFMDRPGDVFLDIGARTGWHGLHASLTGYTPHFIEPARVTALLADSLRRNQIAGVIYPVAASDSNGTLDMVDARTEFYQTSGEGESVTVPCARVDALLPPLDGSVVACKVDVEGHELAVLRGFGELLADVDYLVVEHHPEYADVEATMAYLREWGFREVRMQERNQLLGYYEHE